MGESWRLTAWGGRSGARPPVPEADIFLSRLHRLLGRILDCVMELMRNGLAEEL